MLASQVMRRVEITMNDEDAIRWTRAEKCMWINDALRTIRTLKPDAFERDAVLPLVSGVRQELPASYDRILRVLGNAATANSSPRKRRTVTVVSRDLLDAAVPGWRDPVKRTQQVQHVILDENDPRHYDVYPANDGTGALHAAVAAAHEELTHAGPDPEDLAAYDIELPVRDLYANAVVYYVQYRAYTKDSTFSGPINRATQFYQLFLGELGQNVAADQANSQNHRQGTPPSSAGVTANG